MRTTDTKRDGCTQSECKGLQLRPPTCGSTWGIPLLWQHTPTLTGDSAPAALAEGTSHAQCRFHRSTDCFPRRPRCLAPTAHVRSSTQGPSAGRVQWGLIPYKSHRTEWTLTESNRAKPHPQSLRSSTSDRRGTRRTGSWATCNCPVTMIATAGPAARGRSGRMSASSSSRPTPSRACLLATSTTSLSRPRAASGCHPPLLARAAVPKPAREYAARSGWSACRRGTRSAG